MCYYYSYYCYKDIGFFLLGIIEFFIILNYVVIGILLKQKIKKLNWIWGL